MKLNLGSVFVLGKLSSAFFAFSLDKHLKKIYRTLNANYARTQFGSFGLDSKVSAQNFIEFRHTNNLSKKLRDYIILKTLLFEMFGGHASTTLHISALRRRSLV